MSNSFQIKKWPEQNTCSYSIWAIIFCVISALISGGIVGALLSIVDVFPIPFIPYLDTFSEFVFEDDHIVSFILESLRGAIIGIGVPKTIIWIVQKVRSILQKPPPVVSLSFMVFVIYFFLVSWAAGFYIGNEKGGEVAKEYLPESFVRLDLRVSEGDLIYHQEADIYYIIGIPTEEVEVSAYQIVIGNQHSHVLNYEPQSSDMLWWWGKEITTHSKIDEATRQQLVVETKNEQPVPLENSSSTFFAFLFTLLFFIVKSLQDYKLIFSLIFNGKKMASTWVGTNLIGRLSEKEAAQLTELYISNPDQLQDWMSLHITEEQERIIISHTLEVISKYSVEIKQLGTSKTLVELEDAQSREKLFPLIAKSLGCTFRS